MYTIKDYIKYYKDISVNQVKWNIMDNLICSILVYLPIKSFKGYKNLSELLLYYNDKVLSYGFLANHSLEILKDIVNSKRYSKLRIYNFTKIKNKDMQFGAATFKIKNKTIISFEGTDGSFIGWVENIRLGYIYPTNTQKEAIKYLKNNTLFARNIDVVGHSKGGNLAMVSVMEASNSLFNRINKVYNFDGPGFKDNEYNSLKYKRLESKLVNIIPSLSVVGILLNNDNYNVIKSNSYAFYEHNPLTWNLFGECFIESNINKLSLDLKNSINNGLKELDNDMLGETLETLLKNINKNYDDKFEINFSNLKNIIKNRKNIDKNVSSYLLKILNTLMNINHKNKKKT